VQRPSPDSTNEISKGVLTLIDLAGNDWSDCIGAESLDNSNFEYDNENAIEKMNYTKMSDNCRVTLKLAQLSDIVKKTLYTSIRRLKGAILSLKTPSDINDRILMNSDYVLVDIITQNLKSDSKIFIMGHISFDTVINKTIDSLCFVNKFKNIVEVILKEENLKRKRANMPGTILGELKKELNEESKSEESVLNSCGHKAFDCSVIEKFDISRITCKPIKVRNIESKSIMLPMSRLDFEALTFRDTQTFRTGKELAQGSMLVISYTFKSIMKNTFKRSSSCFCLKIKQNYKVHALPDFNKCIQDYIDIEARENLYRHNTTYLKTTKNTSKRSIPKHSRKNINIDLDKGLSHNESNVVEEHKNYKFDISNGSVTRHCISILSFLNRPSNADMSLQIPKELTQSEVISPMPSQAIHSENKARLMNSSHFSNCLSRIRHRSLAIDDSQATNQI